MSAEVPQAPHADGLREPPLARSSDGNSCLETGGRLGDRGTDGWMEEPRAGQGRRREEGKPRGRGGERGEGGREEGELILSPPLGPLS